MTPFLLGAAALATALVVAQVPSPSPPPSGAPAANESPAATGSPSPGASAAPTPEPTPLYLFVYRPAPQPIPPDDVPAIAEIDLNATVLTPPAPLHVRVLTSVAVVSVTAETSIAFLTRGIPIPKVQPGLFLFDGYVPNVPAFLRNRTFNVAFVATAANGTSVNITLPMRLN